MKHPHTLNAWYSLGLVILGIFGFLARYWEQGDWQFTALIPSFFGIILFAMTSALRKEKPLISHIAVILTLVLVIMVTVLLVKGFFLHPEWGRKQWIFSLVILGGWFCLRAHWIYFAERRRKKSIENR